MRCLVLLQLIFSYTVALSLDMARDSSLVPDVAVKLSPLHLLNFYPTVEWSYEQRITQRQALQLEVGHVINLEVNSGDKFQNKRGVKLKLEGRHYLLRNPSRATIFFVALEPYMNIINFDRKRVVQECFDLGCQYQYNRRYYDKIKYREQGGSGKFGMLVYLDAKSFFDFSAGLTVRNIEYIHPEGGTNTRSVNDGNFLSIPNETTRVAVSPNLGIRFGYRLR